MELDVTALQMLAGADPVSLDSCWITCSWSDGWFCAASNACGVSNVCILTT